MRKILVVDDEKSVQESLRLVLSSDNCRVLMASSGKEGLNIITNDDIDIVFLDILMPEMDGISVLKEIKKINTDIPVVMLTAVSRLSTAIEAMKLGAYDYLTKPFDVEEIRLLVDKIYENLKLKQKMIILSDEIEKTSGGTIVFESEEMANVLSLGRKAAPHDTSVLITGPTGVGKELVARFIHKESPRRNEPFIPIHCAAIPETLFESEIFGYERGAFTGAFKSKPGKLEVAGRGTVFFDEVGEMPAGLQVKLLRVLQERKFSKIGSNELLPLEARIIAATSKDLKKEIESGKFREDLFYRLNVIPIHVPPLRERKQDILPIANYFLSFFGSQMSSRVKAFSPEVERCFVQYDWPGNVRELKNIIERILVLKGNKDIIDIEDLPEDIKQFSVRDVSGDSDSFFAKVEAFEKSLIIDALEKFSWNKSKAAEFLKMSRRILSYKVEKYGLKRKEKENSDS